MSNGALDEAVNSLELARHLYRLADFLDGAAWTIRAVDGDRGRELGVEAVHVRILAKRIGNMRGSLVDASKVARFKATD